MTSLSLQNYNTIPRTSGLLLSPDGRRLILTIQTLSADSARFVSSLWGMPADGSAPARRLTYSAEGESNPAFLPDGSLVFSSARPDPTSKEDEAEGKVWLLPAGAGEAVPVLTVPGGVRGVETAPESQVVVVRGQLFEDAADLAADAAKAKRRKEAPTSAVLFKYPKIRHWDHDLGPRQSRLLRLALPTGDSGPEDLVAKPEMALHEAEYSVAPDGSRVITTWYRSRGRGYYDQDLVLLGDGAPRTIAEGGVYDSPCFSPDGTRVVVVRGGHGSPEGPADVTLWLIELAGASGIDLTPNFDLWPAQPVWAADGSGIFFEADEGGDRPVFHVSADGGEVRRLTQRDHFTSLCPAPDGRSVFALRDSYSSPPEVVRIGVDSSVTALPSPGLPLELPGAVSEVTATAANGATIRGWLVTPKDASAEKPAPLVLWIHGGPLGSWNGWSWRWCPHLLAEAGYAVLLPDPALSTGYGLDFIRRGWGKWGPVVFSELMAITDAALQRPDLDASRTAAMGGSFGGYMANWVAGHTDRFKAIVTHASLWAMDQFQGTTDTPNWWEDEFGNPNEDLKPYLDASPRESLAAITTPMLVIHGNLDYRVPISEALRLWTDLNHQDVPAAYLFFPDENHWILKPGNAAIWYETVRRFLDHHLLGREWSPPDLL